MDSEHRLGATGDLGEQLVAAFSKSSVIALCILDSDRRYQFVNNAMVAMHNSVPTEAFIGRTFRDILEDASPETEARFQRVSLAGETPVMAVRVKLPSRTEPGYWIEKNFAITGRSGRVIQIASLAVEVTGTRELEDHFCKVCGELLLKNAGYQRLARELHDALDGYHAALAMNLDRLSHNVRHPERTPELLDQSTEFLDDHMRRLASAIARCFPLDQQA